MAVECTCKSIDSYILRVASQVTKPIKQITLLLARRVLRQMYKIKIILSCASNIERLQILRAEKPFFCANAYFRKGNKRGKKTT